MPPGRRRGIDSGELGELNDGARPYVLKQAFSLDPDRAMPQCRQPAGRGRPG